MRLNRSAVVYDYIETPLDYFKFAPWRKKLTDNITGNRILEVGVGTGKNLSYYPKRIEITAIDFSPGMLERARRKSLKKGVNIDLIEMDVQQLNFPDNYFDTIFATFVFCSVPDPVLGLKELKRVCKPGGKLILLEHMRPGNAILGFIIDALNPIIVRMMGANVNRRTLEKFVMQDGGFG